MRRALVLVGLAACYKPSPPSGAACNELGQCPTGLVCSTGFVCLPPGEMVDAFTPPEDGMLAPPDGKPIDGPCESFASQLDTCTTSTATATAFTLDNDATYNTDTHLLTIGNTSVTPPHVVITDLAGEHIDMVFVTSLAIHGTLTVTGNNAFGLLVTQDMTVAADGEIDLVGGAGARPTCDITGATPGVSSTFASGGGGGGNSGHGGDGGHADDNVVNPGGGGFGAPDFPSGPIGGCPGGNGGDGTGGAATGGRGGGVLYVAAVGNIDIQGTVNAGGQGGAGGTMPNGGGAGGGAGGMILLESQHVVTISGHVDANGGGGGGAGGDTAGGQSGISGESGTAAAPGGLGALTGSKGGLGGTGATDAKNGVDSSAASGGGGGGVGFFGIAAAASDVQITTSPAAVLLPKP